MKTTIVLMTLLGCDCDMQQCEPIRIAEARWSNVEQCEVAAEAEIARYRGVQFPTLTAICQTDAQGIKTAGTIPDSPDIARESVTATDIPFAESISPHEDEPYYRKVTSVLSKLAVRSGRIVSRAFSHARSYMLART
jgi:hypothetical protein